VEEVLVRARDSESMLVIREQMLMRFKAVMYSTVERAINTMRI
jgi:hypothetical protein